VTTAAVRLRTFVALYVSVILAILVSPAKADEGTLVAKVGEPTQIVDTLHENLLQVMKNAATLGYEGRFQQLKPVVRELFDLSFMAEKSMGKHWKSIGDADRTRMLEAFDRFTVANYAGRFNGYSGQSFETVKEEPSVRGTMLVHSRLLDGGGDAIQLNYRLRRVEDRWRIIDVYLNGTVSELALRRSEYSSLIKREGFAALLSALDKRIDELATSEQANETNPAQSG
jgi:phospholipid transport system substrate-binding protein